MYLYLVVQCPDDEECTELTIYTFLMKPVTWISHSDAALVRVVSECAKYEVVDGF